MKCSSCGNSLALDADPRRLYCSQVCRSAAWRARRSEDRALLEIAVSLLQRQTRAIIAQDHEALAEIQAEAARVLPA